jgi:hypothetical protein
MFNHTLFYYDLLSWSTFDDHTNVITLIQVIAHGKQYVDHLVFYSRLLSVVNMKST